jgi:hypothetical protein
VIQYEVLYTGREDAPEGQPDTLQIDGLGVFTAGEPRKLTSDTLYNYRVMRGIPPTQENLPDNVELTVEIVPDQAEEA